MFQFRPFPSYAYLIQRTITRYCRVGFPHSEICGYNGYLLLPAAFRSLSRPSSAPDAKAFPLRSFQLDLLILVLNSWIMQAIYRKISEIVIVTLHPFGCVPQLKPFKLLLPCLSLSFRCSVFKVRFPVLWDQNEIFNPLNISFCFQMVGLSGLEPPTLRLSVVRSSQLSYKPLWWR